MARAETIESLGEPGGAGGSGPLPRHSTTCRMELPRSFHSWPGLLTTTTITTGPMHLHHHDHRHLPPLQAVYLSYPLPYPQPEGLTHQQSPAASPSATPPPSPPCGWRDVRGGGLFGEQSDSDRVACQEIYSQQGPLPDLLPQNEHSSWASPPHRAPREEPAQEVRRVAHQLRTIGDEFNATVLRRANAAPHWQNWRDACRGLFDFVTQTLSTLYRLT